MPRITTDVGRAASGACCACADTGGDVAHPDPEQLEGDDGEDDFDVTVHGHGGLLGAGRGWNCMPPVLADSWASVTIPDHAGRRARL